MSAPTPYPVLPLRVQVRTDTEYRIDVATLNLLEARLRSAGSDIDFETAKVWCVTQGISV